MKWNDLFNYLEEKFDSVLCNNNYELTRQFCEEHGLDVESVIRRAQGLGGICDCEILFTTSHLIDEEEYIKAIKAETT